MAMAECLDLGVTFVFSSTAFYKMQFAYFQRCFDFVSFESVASFSFVIFFILMAIK